MISAILSLLVFLYLSIGAISYWLIAGVRADWWHLVTYIWIFFWPLVILLGAIYYSPATILALIAVIIISLWFARRLA